MFRSAFKKLCVMLPVVPVKYIARDRVIRITRTSERTAAEINIVEVERDAVVGV